MGGFISAIPDDGHLARVEWNVRCVSIYLAMLGYGSSSAGQLAPVKVEWEETSGQFVFSCGDFLLDHGYNHDTFLTYNWLLNALADEPAMYDPLVHVLLLVITRSSDHDPYRGHLEFVRQLFASLAAGGQRIGSTLVAPFVNMFRFGLPCNVLLARYPLSNATRGWVAAINVRWVLGTVFVPDVTLDNKVALGRAVARCGAGRGDPTPLLKEHARVFAEACEFSIGSVLFVRRADPWRGNFDLPAEAVASSSS